MIKNKKKGILFWLTGLPGAGKTSIANKLINPINKKFGNTILLNGDDIRRIFELTDYSLIGRKRIGMQYSKLFQKITDQKINVLFAGGVLIEEVRKRNRKNIDNYIEIYLKSNQKKIISKNFKKLYLKTKNLVGLKIKPEYPKNPDIIINNNFKKNIKMLSKELTIKINQKLK
jgi:adenylylsulfate kinase-like enzyme